MEPLLSRKFSKLLKGFIALAIILMVIPVNGLLAEKIKDPSILTLERIFSSKEFKAERVPPVKWVNNGNAYTTLEASRKNPKTMDIVLYDLKKGHRKILVPAEKLIPEGEKKPLKIEDFFWTEDMGKLLIYTNSKRVWRRNTRGDYWVLNLKTWKLKKLGGDAKPSTLMFAKFSPDGKRVAYVREHNIYVEYVDQDRIIQLTRDGSKNIINGTSDWVYEEEFNLRDGFRWSPDGKYIAYWQFDTSGVPIFYLINYTDSLYPVLKPIPYPKVGQTNSAVRVGIISSEGGETTWIKIPGDPRNNYLPWMEWVDSKTLILQQMNRLQNTDTVYLADALTGKAKPILVERDSTWVDLVRNVHWLYNKKYFTWLSERDGWRHVYLVSKDGKEIRPVTKGNYDVISIAGLDFKKKWLYFIASPYNAAQRYLYRINLNGKKLKRITPVNSPGFHYYILSSNAKWALHSYSTFDTPPYTELVKLPSHKTVKVLASNEKLRKKVDALKRKPVEFFRVNIGDGIVLDGWCIKPPDFDPSKKYPVLFYVYGEPAGQTVVDRWGGTRYLWHLMLAQHGYIIMSVDNQGTPAPKGRSWRKATYKKLGILISDQQSRAVRKLLKERPYLDPERVGVWGWSGGGTSTLNLIFRYPDLYRVGMSVAPVTMPKYYDSIYEERYMSLPDKNPEGYKLAGPLPFAHQLKGDLLIVHGTGDDNVHIQNTYALVNELIKNNKAFQLMVYPNRSHGIFEGKNTTRHLFELLTRFLEEHLPPGGK